MAEGIPFKARPLGGRGQSIVLVRRYHIKFTGVPLGKLPQAEGVVQRTMFSTVAGRWRLYNLCCLRGLTIPNSSFLTPDFHEKGCRTIISYSSSVLLWWAHQGSNLGPTGYEPVALTN